jgi:hypothetical protein
MEMRLPQDFREFLQLINSNQVEYLLVGGYAVAHYGYPRATGDIDIWVAANPENESRLARALVAFGFSASTVSADFALRENQIIRMGLPPVRIDLLTTVSGRSFTDCYSRSEVRILDGVEVRIISLADLRANKQAAGRLKDLNDLENLPKC